MRARAGYHGRLKPQNCRGCHTDHKGAGRASSNSTKAVRPMTRRFRAARRAPEIRLREVPRAGEEVQPGRAGLQRLPPQGRRAQGLAGPQSAPTATPTTTGRKPSSTTRRRVSRSRANTSTPSAATATRTRPTTRTRRAPASAATRRTTTANKGPQGPVRREVRAATTPRPGSPRPSTTTPTPSTCCAASTATPVHRLPQRQPLQGQDPAGLQLPP